MSNPSEHAQGADMKRGLVLFLASLLLGGCVVVPAGYGYRGDGYYHRDYYHGYYYGNRGYYAYYHDHGQ